MYSFCQFPQALQREEYALFPDYALFLQFILLALAGKL